MMTFRLEKWLWALWLLLGMHFFMHNPGGAGLYLPFNAIGWVFASLLMGLGLWVCTQKGVVRLSRLWLGLGVMASLLWLPMLWGDANLRDYALPRLLGLMGGVLFLFSLYQSLTRDDGRHWLLNLLLGAVAIELTLGLVQFFLLIPGNWIGYDTAVNRPYGIFQQPNVMASFMATGLAVALWQEGSASFSRGASWLRAYLLFGTPLLLVVLQSRVGQLGGGAVVLMMLPMLSQNRAWRRPLLLVALGIVVGFAALYLVEGARRGMEIYQSGGMRSIYWPYAWQLILQKPWLGWGYGGFESLFLHSYMAEKALNPSMVQIEYNLDHPHNELLYWGVEGGLLPILVLLAMAGMLLWRLRGQRWPRALALLALVTPMALHTQTEYPFYHSIVHWFLFLTLIWFIDEECEEMTRPGIRTLVYPHRLLLRFLALAIPLLVVPFMATALHTAWVVTKYERGGFKEPDLLLKVVNPVAWLTRVEFDVNGVRLAVGLQTKNRQELEAYIAWARDFVRHTPRVNIYAGMIEATLALGEGDAARAILSQARLLYPDDPQLGALSRRLSVESHP
ncbi:PglL family O-oligosaccharyltransferase [Aeromonas schubertii]